MARKLIPLALIFVLGSLGGCGSLSDFTTPYPPPGDYARPAIVRGFARAGTYVGAVVGVVVAVVLYLPGKALNLVVDEPLGYTEKEWPFVPMTTCAMVGHYALGLPAEGLHFVFYGAWVDPPEPSTFEHVPAPAEGGRK